MKKFEFKAGKKNRIVIIIIAVIILLISIFAVVKFTGKDDAENPEEKTTSSQVTDDVFIDTQTPTEEDIQPITESSEVLITLAEPDTIKVTNPTKATKPNTTLAQAAKPVTPNKPSSNTSGGIVDVGNDSVKEYSCNVKGHHCESKETHSFIVSLEKKGCPYCGSHSCKSFYTTDEWGNACYDPTKCVKYSEKNDPNEYCQECGKQIGDGSGNTCVRFTVDTKCPSCNKQVNAKTCHSH